MKKKPIIIAMVCAVVLWVAVGIADYALVRGFDRPVFCVCVEPMQDGGSGKYVGLGYSFDIEGSFMPDDEFPGVTRYTYYLFGVEVQTQVRD